MTTWTDGYVAEIGYLYGYYGELNPRRCQLAFLHSGLQPPQIYNACELGFGQGVSINLHGAASGIPWFGTDFNPAQVSFAQDLAAQSGAAVHLADDTFADYVRRDGLPLFDYIGLHGIWSWINESNRQVIVDFIRCKLKPGGIVYISYNSQPGWAAMIPWRELLTTHANRMGAPGLPIAARIDQAMGFARDLMAANPLYAQANPIVAKRFEDMGKQDRHYLAHEYFNRDWLPMSVMQLSAQLKEARLDYACSAHYLDHIDALNLTSEQQQLLSKIHDPIMKEMVRDFCMNQQFRRDYWSKGLRRLAPLEQAAALREHVVILTQHPQDISLKIKGALGEAVMNESVYGPILEYLGDWKPRSIQQIEQALASRNITLIQIVQAVLVLSGSGSLAACQDEKTIETAQVYTDRLNQHICDMARSRSEISFLASPVIGGGVPVNRIHQLFYLR